MTPTNHRRFPRAPLSAQGLLHTGRVQLWTSRRPTLISAANISAGGVFLAMQDAAAPGSYLTLRVDLPGERGFNAMGRVLRRVDGSRTEDNGVAVEFLDLVPSQRSAIQRFVETTLSSASAQHAAG